MHPGMKVSLLGFLGGMGCMLGMISIMLRGQFFPGLFAMGFGFAMWWWSMSLAEYLRDSREQRS